MFNRHVASDEKFEEHNMTLHWSMIGYPVDMQVNLSSIIYPLRSTECLSINFTAIFSFAGIHVIHWHVTPGSS